MITDSAFPDNPIAKIVADSKTALENHAPMSSLALALTLPDICGQIEYGNAPVADRYKKWFNEYIKEYFPNWNESMPYQKFQEIQKMQQDNPSAGWPIFDAEACYKLRCELLHSGNEGIAQHEETVLDDFELFTMNESDPDEVIPAAWVSNDGPTGKKMQLRVDELCRYLWKGALICYEASPRKPEYLKHIPNFLS